MREEDTSKRAHLGGYAGSMQSQKRLRRHIKWAVGWLGVCILLALMDPTPIFIHRQEFDRAAAAWKNTPNEQNSAALLQQQHRNAIIADEARVANTIALFAVGALCYIVILFICRHVRFRKGVPDIHGS